MSHAIKVVCSFNWTGCHSILRRQNAHKSVLLENISFSLCFSPYCLSGKLKTLEPGIWMLMTLALWRTAHKTLWNSKGYTNISGSLLINTLDLRSMTQWHNNHLVLSYLSSMFFLNLHFNIVFRNLKKHPDHYNLNSSVFF